MKQQLSKLEPVALRDIWPHEASHFTNWLAEEENLALLSDEIGIDIELLEKEAGVGKFSVDILAQESGSDRKIVIENQLERTDHDHLGKIITYASGYDAEILIWIVQEAQDEHKQAVEWLNIHATELNIFIVEIKVLRIGDSAPAPQFNVVIQPNDWQKSMKEAGRSNALSTTQTQQLAFWNGFKEFAEQKTTTFTIRKPEGACSVLKTGIKTTIGHIALLAYKDLSQVGCEVLISDPEESYELYDYLHQQKDAIEAELQLRLDWQRLEGKQRSKIKLLEDIDAPNNDARPACWLPHYEWMLATAEKFQQVFAPRIAKFQDGDAD